MKNLNLRHLLIRLVVVIISFQICRLLFYIFNSNSFDGLDALLFLGGLRFDLSIIAYFNFVFILAFIISLKVKFSKRLSNGLNTAFLVVNSIIIFLNFIDFEYYKFTGVRSTSDIIFVKGMHNELPKLLLSFITDYWYLLVLGVFLIGGMKLILSKFKIDYSNNLSSNKSIAVVSLLLIGFTFLGARGGFQPRPIKEVDALYYGSVKNASVVLNTPFCVVKSYFRKGDLLKQFDFYSKEALLEKYNPIVTLDSQTNFNKKNIVFLILESFGEESVGVNNALQSKTPFLDSLLNKSLHFNNAFANGRRSVSSVPALVSSIPKLMDRSYVDSRYIYNEVNALPVLLKKKGYQSAFFHGAENGSQNFDRYAKVAGFDQYFGMNEYPNKSHYDGRWGIFDHQYLPYTLSEISKFKSPFFTTIFTLSSHFPYTIPKGFENKYPKGELDIHETIGYVDDALKQFFKDAEQTDWYKNTVFVISADHCSSEGQDYFATNVGKYRIPIAIFDPSNPKLAKKVSKPFQQIDVLPTLLEYLNYNGKIATFGKSGFGKDNLVAFYHANVYHFIKDNYYVQFDGNKIISLYDLVLDPMQTKDLKSELPNVVRELSSVIKAYIQTYNSMLINNKFHP